MTTTLPPDSVMSHEFTPSATSAAVPLSDSAATAARTRNTVAQATRTIAPVWPLRHFVAVNPFLGLSEQTFMQAAQTLDRVAGARLTMPRSFYADAITSGRISTAHLERALREARAAMPASLSTMLPASADALRKIASQHTAAASPASAVKTVTDVATAVTGIEWSRFTTERISSWAATRFDEGQASWRSPWRDLPPFEAWRAEALLDRTPEVMGIPRFRAIVDTLPATASALIPAALARLGVPEAALSDYLQRLLLQVGGWAAYARYQVWNSELYGQDDDTLLQLLAVQLAHEVIVLEAFALRGLDSVWKAACGAMTAPSATDMCPQLAIDVVLQGAYDVSWQDGLIARINGTAAAANASAPVSTRPSAQAAFCIDVRSEVYRRALESMNTGIETIGFAGFFGFFMEYVPVGQEQGGAQCPVLLTPGITIAETVHDAPHETSRVSARRLQARRALSVWKSFKMGAISCFGFVGPVGLAFGRKLVTDGFGLTRPVPHPTLDGISAATQSRLGPTLETSALNGRATGIAPDARLVMAETVLKAMSMTENFARVVLLAGHGSSTVNNPHATGLDCGACGGHTGEANARVAAAVLNDPAVRAGLIARGLPVPADTIFLAGLHDTTTDDMTLFDLHTVPASHTADLAWLTSQLAGAAVKARAERSGGLKLAQAADIDDAVRFRSRDWAQVRPEWGLAGCAAFIAAPRRRTAHVDLGGRSFLHSYEWQQDAGFGVLELIMTAPMVVASWISLQYYGSTVDNDHFGCGNKVLHNVVGTLGVLEGNGGDLRTGLPWQSVHDGEKLVHEPLRLNVVIEAPIEAMNAVIAKHDGVRALLDNGWLNLWAMDGEGMMSHRYVGGMDWVAVPDASARRSAA